MTLVAPPRSLLELAAEIQDAHAAFVSKASASLEYARQAGALLIEAKALVAHGEWLPWLATNCTDITARTAQGYMTISREWSRLQEIQEKRNGVSSLSLRKALSLLAAEWSDPDELSEGGSSVEPPPDPPHDDDDDDDPPPHLHHVTLTFASFEAKAEFRRQVAAAQRALGTTNKTATVERCIGIVVNASQEAPSENRSVDGLGHGLDSRPVDGPMAG